MLIKNLLKAHRSRTRIRGGVLKLNRDSRFSQMGMKIHTIICHKKDAQKFKNVIDRLQFLECRNTYKTVLHHQNHHHIIHLKATKLSHTSKNIQIATKIRFKFNN